MRIIIRDTTRITRWAIITCQRLHPLASGAFIRSMLARIIGTTIMFIRPISSATVVLNSGSTTLRRSRPVETVPVHVPKIVMVRSKFRVSMRLPR